MTTMGAGMSGVILSILMLAGIVLTGGGIYAIARRGDRQRGILMIIAGLVMFANVAIAAIPGQVVPPPAPARAPGRP